MYLLSHSITFSVLYSFTVFSSLRQLYLFLRDIASWTMQLDGTLGFSIWKFAHVLNHEGDNV